MSRRGRQKNKKSDNSDKKKDILITEKIKRIKIKQKHKKTACRATYNKSGASVIVVILDIDILVLLSIVAVVVALIAFKSLLFSSALELGFCFLSFLLLRFLSFFFYYFHLNILTRSTLNIISQWITRRAAACAGRGEKKKRGTIAQMDTLANKLHLMGEHFTAMTTTATTRSQDETRCDKTRGAVSPSRCE